MKELGYEIDKRQITQMLEYFDESGKGLITKDAFIKFMTARLVIAHAGRISGTSRRSSNRRSSTTTTSRKGLSDWETSKE